MGASRNSRSTDRLRQAVLESLNRHVERGQRLVVGLSGGIDSVALLHAVRTAGWPLSAVHVHHGLSQFADDWADFCRELCQSWQVDLSLVHVGVERASDDGLEAAARRARHAAFDRIAADWLLLAHHQGDRAETLLFNLLRGAGVRGAGALAERSGRILRPLLSVDRAAIVDYAGAHELRWVEDDSNADGRFSRNFIRHRVLPAMEERFPAGAARLAAAAARFAEAADLLDELAVADLAPARPDFPVSIDQLARLSEARARNALRFLLWTAGVGVASEERLAEALRQCLQAAPDRHPAIAFGNHILRRRGRLICLESI